MSPPAAGSPCEATTPDRSQGLNQALEAQAEADAIQPKRVLRKGGLPPTMAKKRRPRAAPDGQGPFLPPAARPICNHDEVTMNLFNKLPGLPRSQPGWEQRIWQRLPAILLWGTLLPLGLAGLNRALAPAVSESGAGAGALLLWDFTMIGVVVLHWTLVLTLALGCFIVRVMKGPAYVADAYPLPSESDESSRRL